MNWSGRPYNVAGIVLVCGALLVASHSFEGIAPAAGQERAQTKAQAIEHIERLKGEVRLDGEHPDEPVWMVDLSRGELDDDVLELLKLFPKLEVLHLQDLPVTDNHLVAIGRLKSLHELSLDGTRITDAGLKSLRTLTELEKLSISRTEVTNAGLIHLAPLRKLKDLTTFETAVTDQAVENQFAGRVKVFAGDNGGSERSDPSRLPRPEPIAEVQEEHLTGDPAEELAEQFHAQGVAILRGGRDRSNRRQAVDLLEVAVANDLSCVDCRINLADAYASSGNPLAMALAIELYDEALTDLPNDESILARLVDAYLGLNNFAAARDVLRRRSDDSATTAVQLALITIASRDYDAGIKALRQIKHPLGRSLADVVMQLRPVNRGEPPLRATTPAQRTPQESSPDLWQRLVTTHEHLEKVTSIVSAATGGLNDDRQKLIELIDELNHCLDVSELSEQQVRFYAAKLSLGVGGQILSDELALLRSDDFRRESVDGDWSQLQRWQALATVGFWKAIHDATQDIASSDRLHAEECLGNVLEKLVTDQPAERQMLADQIGALAHQLENARSTPTEAATRNALRELHGHVERREWQQQDQRIVLTFLLRSVSGNHRSESNIGGSQMLSMFKMTPLTGSAHPGGLVWLDRADALDLWLRSAALGASRHSSRTRIAKESAARQFPKSNVLLAVASKFAESQPGRDVALANRIQQIRNEVALQQVSGAMDDDLADGMLGELRKVVVENERREPLTDGGNSPGP